MTGGGGIPRWLVGVMINIMGSVSINFGTNLMKLSHNDRDRRAKEEALRELKEAGLSMAEEPNGSGSMDEEPDLMVRKGGLLVSLLNRLRFWRKVAPSGGGGSMPRRSMKESCRAACVPDKPIKEWLREKVWFVGVVIFVTGSILVFVSFAYAPQSMLAALGSSQFVSNVFFARFVLGERITLRVVTATCIIIGGQVLIVLFSARISRTYTALDLMALYNQTYLTYLGSIFIVCVCLQLTYRQFRYYESLGRSLPYSSTVLPITYAMFSALVGTFSVLQSKCLSALLGHTLSGNNQFKYFFTWIVLFMWLTLTLFWLHRMNTALLLFDGLFIIPVLQVFWTFFAIVGGGVYFQEFQEYTPRNFVGFCCGVFIIFTGVVLLSPRRAVVPDDEFVAMGDDEEACSPHLYSTSPTSAGSPVAVTDGYANVSPLPRGREGSGDSAEHAHRAKQPSGGSSKHLVRRNSLEVLERRNSRLISIGTMPFITNDEGLASFVDQIAPATEEDRGHGRQGSQRDLINALSSSGTLRASRDHNHRQGSSGHMVHASVGAEGGGAHSAARSSRDRMSASGDLAHHAHQAMGPHHPPGSGVPGGSSTGRRRESLDEILDAKRGSRESRDKPHAADKPSDKPAADRRSPETPAEKPADKPVEAEKPVEKAAEKPTAQAAPAQGEGPSPAAPTPTTEPKPQAESESPANGVGQAQAPHAAWTPPGDTEKQDPATR